MIAFTSFYQQGILLLIIDFPNYTNISLLGNNLP